MTQDQVLGIVRHVLTFGGGVVVALGYADEGLMAEISGAVMTLVGAAWSIMQKQGKAP